MIFVWLLGGPAVERLGFRRAEGSGFMSDLSKEPNQRELFGGPG